MKKTLIFLFILSFQFFMSQTQDKKLQEKYHQFDFWLGNWDVYKFGTDSIAGKSRIESIIDGIGILENYITKGKYEGKSLNKYNPTKERWEQYWIDNSGLTLFLTGGIKNGKMILDDALSANPKEGINQIVWEFLKTGSVRQTWNFSQDGGKTWKVLFDGEYKKSK